MTVSRAEYSTLTRIWSDAGVGLGRSATSILLRSLVKTRDFMLCCILTLFSRVGMRWISFEIVRRSHSTGEEDMHLEVRSRGERRRTLRGSSWLTTTTVHRTLGTAPFQILYYCITTYVHVSHSFLNYSPYYSLNDERQWQRTVSAECGVAVRAIHTIMSHDDDLHHHWQALVLAMASCTDNFLVGLCTGVAHRPLSAKVLWGIATCNATGSLVAAAAGGAFVSVVASTGYISSKVMTTLLVIASATVPYR